MHCEGEGSEHVLHAIEVRNTWLAAAMREAEDDDRESGVWDLVSDKWETGDFVVVESLKSRPDLNGATGILLQWVKASSRWGVSVVSTDERVKIKPANLRRIASAGKRIESGAPVRPAVLVECLPAAGDSVVVRLQFSSKPAAKSAVEMAADIVATMPQVAADIAGRLPGVGAYVLNPYSIQGRGIAAAVASGVAQEASSGRISSIEALADAVAVQLMVAQFAVIDGFLEPPKVDEGEAAEAAVAVEAGGCTAVHALLRSMHGSGKLQPGDVAGGRAAAAYARITGVPLPRGDLMAWLGAAEYVKHAPLRRYLGAVDALVRALEATPRLRDELGGRTPLRREEMQLTCYPGDGARYVKHVDNNDVERGGRRLTTIYYANEAWCEGDGGELRVYPPNDGGDESSAVTDVAPIGDRFLCFWSDKRVPHEVMPTYAPRYAVSIWFEDA